MILLNTSSLPLKTLHKIYYFSYLQHMIFPSSDIPYLKCSALFILFVAYKRGRMIDP